MISAKQLLAKFALCFFVAGAYMHISAGAGEMARP
jgi:hypothetical protein